MTEIDDIAKDGPTNLTETIESSDPDFFVCDASPISERHMELVDTDLALKCQGEYIKGDFDDILLM